GDDGTAFDLVPELLLPTDQHAFVHGVGELGHADGVERALGRLSPRGLGGPGAGVARIRARRAALLIFRLVTDVRRLAPGMAIIMRLRRYWRRGIPVIARIDGVGRGLLAYIGRILDQGGQRLADGDGAADLGQRTGQIALAEHLYVHDGLVGLDRSHDIA